VIPDNMLAQASPFVIFPGNMTLDLTAEDMKGFPAMLRQNS
jgi:hypothetical protein